MQTAIISLGGEDYSIQYEINNNEIQIDSLNNMYNKEIFITNELEEEIIDKINKL